MSPSDLPGVMAFYCPDGAMDQRLRSLVASLEAQHPGLSATVSITWLRYRRPAEESPEPSRPAAGDAGTGDLNLGPGHRQAHGASWQPELLHDPSALVRLAYLTAVEVWLQQDLLQDSAELRQALQAMIRRGSSEATSLVVDLLTGTTSGPSLAAVPAAAWMQRRQLLNRWLESLGWPELQGNRICQKPWQDGPYGRDRDLWAALGGAGNRLSSDGLARLLHAAMEGSLVSPAALRRLRDLVQWPPLPLPDGRSAASADPPPQLRWLRELFPSPGCLWGLVADEAPHWHQALYSEQPGQEPILLVLLCESATATSAITALQSLSRRLLSSGPSPEAAPAPPPPPLPVDPDGSSGLSCGT